MHNICSYIKSHRGRFQNDCKVYVFWNYYEEVAHLILCACACVWAYTPLRRICQKLKYVNYETRIIKNNGNLKANLKIKTSTPT